MVNKNSSCLVAIFCLMYIIAGCKTPASFQSTKLAEEVVEAMSVEPRVLMRGKINTIYVSIHKSVGIVYAFELNIGYNPKIFSPVDAKMHQNSDALFEHNPLANHGIMWKFAGATLEGVSPGIFLELTVAVPQDAPDTIEVVYSGSCWNVLDTDKTGVELEIKVQKKILTFQVR